MYEGLEDELKQLMTLIHKKHPRRDAIDETRVRRLIEQSYKKKQTLRECLGLGEDLRRSFTLASTNFINEELATTVKGGLANFSWRDHFPEKVQKQYDSDERDTLDQIRSNEIKIDGKRTMKLSRWLTTALKGKEDLFLTEVNNRLPREKQIGNFATLLTKLFEVKSLPVVLTANPIDFMIISEKAEYDSCIGFDGCNANGSLAYTLDDFSAYLYTVRPEDFGNPLHTKLGRAMLYLDKAGKRFIIGRKYGTLHTEQVREISKQISSTLAETMGITNRWRAFTKDLYFPVENLEGIVDDEDGGNVYFDMAISRYVVHSGSGEEGDTEEQPDKNRFPYFAFECAPCLCCGDTMYKNDSEWVCEECGDGRNECYNCDYRIERGDEYEFDGYTYCNECYADQVARCRDCREEDYKSNLTDHEGHYYCRDCYRDRFAHCAGCSKVTDKDDLTEYQENDYCEACYEDKLEEEKRREQESMDEEAGETETEEAVA